VHQAKEIAGAFVPTRHFVPNKGLAFTYRKAVAEGAWKLLLPAMFAFKAPIEGGPLSYWQIELTYSDAQRRLLQKSSTKQTERPPSWAADQVRTRHQSQGG
jgi:hypothetical protein